MLRNTIRGALSCRNLLEILHDDQDLARADQPKLPAGQCLDGGRIFLKTTGFIAEGGVFVLEPFDTFGRSVEVLPGLEGTGQPTVTEQPVEQQHAAEKQHRAASPARLTAPACDD